MTEESPRTSPGLFGLLLRSFLFLIFIRYGGGLFGLILYGMFGSTFVAAAISIFLAAALASWFVVRVFERGRLEDIGMGWSPASLRHLGLGFMGGFGAALAVILIPVAAGLAEFVRSPDPANSFGAGKFAMVSTVLLFGVVGEEMMFRGYAFQVLLKRCGPWIIIPSFALLFAGAHLGNMHSDWLGMGNTALWGLLLGYAFYRSGDLWLPIGLHFGWNWALPLFGVNLSGFTMGLTGLTLRWNAAPQLSGGDYGPEASIFTTVAAASLGVLIWKARIERQEAPLLAHAKES
jgi:uncharacterized protein